MRFILTIILACFLGVASAATPTSLQNNFAVTLKTSNVASVFVDAYDLEGDHFLNQQHDIIALKPFIDYLKNRITMVTVHYPNVAGYGLFFANIRFSPKAIDALNRLLNTMQINNKPLSQQIKQIGFVGNALTSAEVPSLVRLVSTLKNLYYLDVASNDHFSAITHLILTLDALPKFQGLNTRRTNLNSRSTFYLLRSVVQNHWLGLPLNVNDIFEANALLQVYKLVHLDHIGIRFSPYVGRQSIDLLLESLVKTQHGLKGIHLGFPKNYVISEKEARLLAQLVQINNANLHILTIRAMGAGPEVRTIILSAIDEAPAIYGLGLTANFFEGNQLEHVIQTQNTIAAIQPLGYVQPSQLIRLVKASSTHICLDVSDARKKIANHQLDVPAHYICSNTVPIEQNRWRMMDEANVGNDQ